MFVENLVAPKRNKVGRIDVYCCVLVFQTLIVGDSRAKYLMEKWQEEGDGTVWWKIKSGAKMTDVLKMIEEAEEEGKEVDLVIIIAIVCDVYQLYTSGLKEWPSPRKLMGLNAKVVGPEYPSEQGVGEEVKKVEREVKKRWSEAEVLWVTPYPFDCKRYVRSRNAEGGEEMPRKVAEELDKLTYEGVRHLRKLEPFIRKNVRRYMSVSWFPYWKSVGDGKGSYKTFMDEANVGGKSGIELCPEATKDGVHPTQEVCVALIRTLREVIKNIKRRRRQDVKKNQKSEGKQLRSVEERKERIEEMRGRVEEILILREMVEGDEEEGGAKGPEESGKIEIFQTEKKEEEEREGVEEGCFTFIQWVHYPCDHWEMANSLLEKAVCPVCGGEWRLKEEDGEKTARVETYQLTVRVLEVVVEEEE